MQVSSCFTETCRACGKAEQPERRHALDISMSVVLVLAYPHWLHMFVSLDNKELHGKTFSSSKDLYRCRSYALWSACDSSLTPDTIPAIGRDSMVTEHLADQAAQMSMTAKSHDAPRRFSATSSMVSSDQ